MLKLGPLRAAANVSTQSRFVILKNDFFFDFLQGFVIHVKNLYCPLLADPPPSLKYKINCLVRANTYIYPTFVIPVTSGFN